jgi:hypothetical protein
MDGGERPSPYRLARGAVTRPAALAAAAWADYAEVRVALGLVDSWAPSGGQWDGASWDVGTWGESYLTPAEWLDVTPDVMSVDVDTGRNGVDDPGDAGTATLILYDPEGTYAIAGSDHWAVGNLLRIEVEHVASSSARMLFYGKVTDASSTGDLVAPSSNVRAIDLVGALLSTDDDTGIGAQSVSDRLGELLDRAGVPAELRDIAPDLTGLLAVDKAGNRLDAARGAVSSSVGGTLYAVGDGTIRYRFGAFLYSPEIEPRFSIGTVEGSICPSVLNLSEKGADIKNSYSWTTGDRDAPLNAAADDDDSIRRYGRAASVRTDLLNSDQSQLGALVAAELARTAWAPERVDSCSVPVHDDQSAIAVLAELGDLVQFDYSGSAPWSSLQLVGGYGHHITPDEWTVELNAYPAMVASLWDYSCWDVDEWSLGGVPMSTGRDAVQIDLKSDLSIPATAYVDALVAPFVPSGSSVKAELTCTGTSDTQCPRTFFQVTIIPTGAETPNFTTTQLLAAPATPWPGADLFAGGSAIFRDLEPGTAYTFRLQISTWQGTFTIRAGSWPNLENLRLIVSDI